MREVTKVIRYYQEYAPARAAATDVFDKRTHVVVIRARAK